ncbi:MAG: DUF3108 domain-containing protein [Gammaproteobacteria bacterium]
MRTLTHLFMALPLLLSSPSYAFKLPENFLAEYRLEKYNTTVAEMSLQLTTHGQQYIYKSVTHPYGIASLFSSDEAHETSTLFQDHDRHKPYLQGYEFSRKKNNKRNLRVDLDWSEQDMAMIKGNYGDTKIKLLHQGILWDRLSVQLALMDDIRRSIDIPTGHVFNYNVIDRDRISNYRFSYEGKQHIRLNKHQYNVAKLKRDHGSSDRVTILWLAEELDFVPVKVEQFKKGKLHLSMELSKFTRQKP